ncbi:MAG TPA: hypothetical protein VGX52_08215 [Burkholderiales bacterium]|nr:hypothetical protein [Burkholderiales bacterium]
MKQVLVLVVMTAFAGAAAAQLRTIPQDAKRGKISHLQGMQVAIDGKGQRLSPGVQIRDPDNRLLLPAYLPVKSDVKYLLDRDGMVHRVWILTTQEKAQADKAKTLPARK